MCQEIFQMVQKMDLEKIENSLALHCAPLITGLKISNLLMIDSGSEGALRIILRRTGISYFRLLNTEGRTAYILFRRSQLEEYLAITENRKLLMELGYEDFSLGYILRIFQKRYQAYMYRGERFPHEMGILLGYPLEDVIGFMNNNGQNFLYSGYWKVYSDVAGKKRLFEKYEKSKECLIRLLDEDIDMRTILQEMAV